MAKRGLLLPGGGPGERGSQPYRVMGGTARPRGRHGVTTPCVSALQGDGRAALAAVGGRRPSPEARQGDETPWEPSGAECLSLKVLRGDVGRSVGLGALSLRILWSGAPSIKAQW